jgi:hypothetical protein
LTAKGFVLWHGPVSRVENISDITGQISLHVEAHRVNSKLHEELFPVRSALLSVESLLL